MFGIDWAADVDIQLGGEKLKKLKSEKSNT